jgi:hypothetical protein
VATSPVPLKTPEGLAELGTRQRRLSQRHRTLLLLIDGRRSLSEVLQLATQAGVPESCLDDLVSQGLVEVPAPDVPVPPEEGPLAQPLGEELDIHLGDEPEDESELPTQGTLQPESELSESMLAESVADQTDDSEHGNLEDEDGVRAHPLEEARRFLIQAVRSEAPLAGSLTVLRLKRARTADDLFELLDEVDARITKARRSPSAEQMMMRVRQLLAEADMMASTPSASL